MFKYSTLMNWTWRFKKLKVWRFKKFFTVLNFKLLDFRFFYTLLILWFVFNTIKYFYQQY